MRRQKPPDLISASEIACFAYSPEQWRRQYLLGEEPAHQTGIEAGNRHHRQKERVERSACALIVMGRLMALIALLTLVWLVWFQLMDTNWMTAIVFLGLFMAVCLHGLVRSLRKRHALAPRLFHALFICLTFPCYGHAHPKISEPEIIVSKYSFCRSDNDCMLIEDRCYPWRWRTLNKSGLDKYNRFLLTNDNLVLCRTLGAERPRIGCINGHCNLIPDKSGCKLKTKTGECIMFSN